MIGFEKTKELNDNEDEVKQAIGKSSGLFVVRLMSN